jgi:hypothetical protein
MVPHLGPLHAVGRELDFETALPQRLADPRRRFGVVLDRQQPSFACCPAVSSSREGLKAVARDLCLGV